VTATAIPTTTNTTTTAITHRALRQRRSAGKVTPSRGVIDA
jgi:hypothetical protein